MDPAHLLRALGTELAWLAGVAEALQDALAPEADASAADTQALDHLTQHLFALAALARDGASGGAQADAALDALPLSDLARRLRGLAPTPCVAAGEADWFGAG